MIENVNLNNLTYHLPKHCIAEYPLPCRDESKLLIYKNKKLSHDIFRNISEYIKQDSLLVFNNSRVIQSRIFFKKSTGALIEIFCLEPVLPSNYEQIFQTTTTCVWKCFIGNANKWKQGILYKEFYFNNTLYSLSAEKISTIENQYIIKFTFHPSITFGEVLESCGEIPIPPYIKRNANEQDKITYQTIYAKPQGSVAAPTAGLHFTNRVFDDFKNKNIHSTYITLHIGAGTFTPIKTPNILEHNMHIETVHITSDLLTTLKKFNTNITAVGTTSVRALESIYWLGVKLYTNPNTNTPLHIKQWEAYNLPQHISIQIAMDTLIEFMNTYNLNSISFTTQLMIVPGYTFKFPEALITNFHLPQSTLLLLINAFIGSEWKNVYNYALQNNFRFLSYGDSSILFK